MIIESRLRSRKDRMIIAQGERSAALGTQSIFGLAPQRGAATSILSQKQILVIAVKSLASIPCAPQP